MRPFDCRRNGRVLGEGAGILVLEKKQRALERGAKIYGALVSCASTGGPVAINQYEAGAEQMGRAVQNAIKGAGISPSEVDYICATANSSLRIPISSLKGHIGDFCGSGVLRAAALLLSMKNGKILPTFGLKDPEFDLDHVIDQPRTWPIQYALLDGFSFGGSNVCLLFKNES
jgi:3-oxoacyl-(acyl-carrier-protein) synthase